MQGNSKDIDPFKASEVLTPRMQKGYNFERLVWRELEGLEFQWALEKGLGIREGADFWHKTYPIEIEAKFSHAVIYPSWVKRDWIIRFNDKARVKIVVCNRGIKLTEKAKALLRENKIYLIFIDQLKRVVKALIQLFMMGVTNSLNSSNRYNTKTNSYCSLYSSPSTNIRNKNVSNTTSHSTLSLKKHVLDGYSLYPSIPILHIIAYSIGLNPLNLPLTIPLQRLEIHKLKPSGLIPLSSILTTYSHSSKHLRLTDMDRYFILSRVFRLITFVKSQFRKIIYETFPCPLGHSKIILPKDLINSSHLPTETFNTYGSLDSHQTLKHLNKGRYRLKTLLFVNFPHWFLSRIVSIRERIVKKQAHSINFGHLRDSSYTLIANGHLTMDNKVSQKHLVTKRYNSFFCSNLLSLRHLKTLLETHRQKKKRKLVEGFRSSKAVSPFRFCDKFVAFTQVFG
jgi:hypothetical protein